jgi:hypothetical protein
VFSISGHAARTGTLAMPPTQALWPSESAATVAAAAGRAEATAGLCAHLRAIV